LAKLITTDLSDALPALALLEAVERATPPGTTGSKAPTCTDTTVSKSQALRQIILKGTTLPRTGTGKSEITLQGGPAARSGARAISWSPSRKSAGSSSDSFGPPPLLDRRMPRS